MSWVVAAATADFRHGIALLSMATPGHLNADVTIRNEPVITTIEQLDAELTKAGLPPSGEIFKIDYKEPGTFRRRRGGGRKTKWPRPV